MRKVEYKMHLWANTWTACKLHPDQYSRTDETVCEQKFRQNLHSVMHRAGEVDTDY